MVFGCALRRPPRCAAQKAPHRPGGKMGLWGCEDELGGRGLFFSPVLGRKPLWCGQRKYLVVNAGCI